jgi:antitoxin ParD1/3/4
MKLSLDKTQLKQTVREIMLEIFAENQEEIYQFLTQIIKEIYLSKPNEMDLDLEESANLYAEIYQESRK